MKREPRTEIVSVRLTKAERARLEAMGGPSAALRRALWSGGEPAPPTPPWNAVVPVTGVSNGGNGGVIWADGTVGGTWPPVLTR